LADIFYLFIAVPIIFIVTLAFIFTSSVSAIQAQQLKINCPYPINAGVATSVNSDGITVTYNVTHDLSSSDYHMTVFHCGENSPTSVTTTVYTSPANNWFNIGLGYLAYLSNSITEFFSKVVAVITLMYLVITAPAQISGLAFFNYIYLVFLIFISLGIFMMVRG